MSSLRRAAFAADSRPVPGTTSRYAVRSPAKTSAAWLGSGSSHGEKESPKEAISRASSMMPVRSPGPKLRDSAGRDTAITSSASRAAALLGAVVTITSAPSEASSVNVAPTDQMAKAQ